MNPVPAINVPRRQPRSTPGNFLTILGYAYISTSVDRFTNMWFILVDAHSKWPEVVKLPIGATTTSQTISLLRQMFSRFSIPKQIVTDNGLQFASKEFKRFCQQQGILRTLTPPYHPRSNGQAKRFVQSFKQAVRKGLEEPQAKLDEVVQSFLAVYRNTDHSTTGASPAQLLMNRIYGVNWICCFPHSESRVKPNCCRKRCRSLKGSKRTHDKTAKHREPFQVGDLVLVR